MRGRRRFRGHSRPLIPRRLGVQPLKRFGRAPIHHRDRHIEVNTRLGRETPRGNRWRRQALHGPVAGRHPAWTSASARVLRTMRPRVRVMPPRCCFKRMGFPTTTSSGGGSRCWSVHLTLSEFARPGRTSTIRRSSARTGLSHIDHDPGAARHAVRPDLRADGSLGVPLRARPFQTVWLDSGAIASATCTTPPATTCERRCSAPSIL